MLESFDALPIGLTATPFEPTAGVFQSNVVEGSPYVTTRRGNSIKDAEGGFNQRGSSSPTTRGPIRGFR